MAIRFDRGSFRRPVRTDAGFLRSEGYLTRAGVFEYRRPDGSVKRELRPPEEVFRADSLDTLQAAPLTLRHPAEAVTAANAKRYAVGTVGTDVRRDADFARATVMVTDADAVAAVESKTVVELSCGYRCDVDETPGVHPTFGAYDAIQRGIVYNHVALVEVGRAGPEVRIRLDAEDAVQVESDPQTPPSTPQQRTDSMKTIRIDGVDYEVSEQAAQAITKALAQHEAEAAKLRADAAEKAKAVDTVQAKLDAQAAELKKAQERADAAAKPEAVQAAVKARLDLERTAREVLGEEKAKELKLDEADDAAIRAAVIGARFPEVKLDGKSDDYVAALYDAALAAKPVEQPRNVGLGAARARADAAGASGSPAEEARKRMLERSRNAWRPQEAAK